MKLMNAEEVAEILGVSPITVRRWASTRKISSVRLSARIMFRLEDVQWVVEHHRVAAIGQEVVAAGAA